MKMKKQLLQDRTDLVVDPFPISIYSSVCINGLLLNVCSVFTCINRLMSPLHRRRSNIDVRLFPINPRHVGQIPFPFTEQSSRLCI